MCNVRSKVCQIFKTFLFFKNISTAVTSLGGNMFVHNNLFKIILKDKTSTLSNIPFYIEKRMKIIFLLNILQIVYWKYYFTIYCLDYKL